MAEPNKSNETAAEKAERERKEREQRERNKPDPSQTPTTTPGAKSSNKALAYTPGMRTPTQTGDDRGDTFLTDDEIKSIAGDLAPGEIGWVELDDNGTPQGAVKRELPDPAGESVARVVGSPTHKYDEVVTPAGAPLSKFMNPDPALWDAGMLARNPINQEEQKKSDERVGRSGFAGVVNKPGTV